MPAGQGSPAWAIRRRSLADHPVEPAVSRRSWQRLALGDRVDAPPNLRHSDSAWLWTQGTCRPLLRSGGRGADPAYKRVDPRRNQRHIRKRQSGSRTSRSAIWYRRRHGFITFHDAWISPEALSKTDEGLLEDVMTPHHGDYYGGKVYTGGTQRRAPHSSHRFRFSDPGSVPIDSRHVSLRPRLR